MRKQLLPFIVAPLLILAETSSVDALQGSSCKRAGTTQGNLVCTKRNGRLRWVVSKVPSAIPVAPVASFTPENGILLSWQKPLSSGRSPIIAYQLQFMTPATPWLEVSALPATQTFQYIKNDGLSGIQLRFRLAAINQNGAGPFTESNWVTYGAVVTTPTTPSPRVVVPVSPTTTNYVAPTTTTTTFVTNSKTQASRTATSYLRYMAFSRSGLIRQLEFEGFSNEDATYGVDAQNADWNAQAAKMAASYLRSMSFSRSGLINQLIFEGFTQSQAEYGVNSVGL